MENITSPCGFLYMATWHINSSCGVVCLLKAELFEAMSIHQNDDYKKLVELLYPSIEASGNLYYGQTRKLTMDEILGKNDLGFESHIDSVRVSSPSADYGYEYKTYFYWKLGPWSGSFEYKPNYDYEVYYGKYKLNIEHKTIQNELNSGTFNSFEKDVTVEYIDKVLTGGDDPTGTEDYDGRNFYVEKESGKYFLYIAVPQNTEDYTGPLTLKAVDGDVLIKIQGYATVIGAAEECSTYTESGDVKINHWYQYKLDSDPEWKNYEDTDIMVTNRHSVSFRATSHRPIFDQNMQESNYAMFIITGTGYVKAYGSILSMSAFDTVTDQHYTQPGDYNYLFAFCDKLKRAPSLIYDSSLYTRRMFYRTFLDCTGITETPIIHATTVHTSQVFDETFSGCSNLSVVKCDVLAVDYDNTFIDWLDNVASSGTFYVNEKTSIFSVLPFNSPSGVPVGWKVRDLHHKHATCMMRIVPNEGHNHTVHYGNLVVTDSKGVKFTPSEYCGPFSSEVTVEFIGFKNSNVLNENNISIGEINQVTYYTDEYMYYASVHNITMTSGAYEAVDDRGIMLIYGQDSPTNGRGSITDKSTLSNMETSFDENETHPMNSYNDDGSYNQEIWGYKCFNSPVQFRNGIYGNNYSIVETMLSNSTNVVSIAAPVLIRQPIYISNTDTSAYAEVTSENNLKLNFSVIPKMQDQPDVSDTSSAEPPVGTVTLLMIKPNKQFGNSFSVRPLLLGKKYHTTTSNDASDYFLPCQQNAWQCCGMKLYLVKINTAGGFDEGSECTDGIYVGLTEGPTITYNHSEEIITPESFIILAIRIK